MITTSTHGDVVYSTNDIDWEARTWQLACQLYRCSGAEFAGYEEERQRMRENAVKEAKTFIEVYCKNMEGEIMDVEQIKDNLWDSKKSIMHCGDSEAR